MKPHRTVPAIVFVVLAAVGAGGPRAVLAQEGEDLAAPAVHSWALAPTGTNPDEPGSRPNLSYEVPPGASIEDSVTLWNYGNTQLTFRTYATDAFNNETGGFDALPGDKVPADAGAWVSLPQENVTVPANSKVDLPLKLTVPADASPGDHAGAVLASSPAEGRDSEGRVVTLDRRTGSRVYLRVAGPLSPALSVEEVRTVYRSSLSPLNGTFDVSYTVRNTGNVRLGATQRVEVQNLFGRKMDERKLDDITELLPGNAVTFRAQFEGVTAALRVTAKPIVTPFAVGEGDTTAPPSVSGEGHAWAVPWSVVAVLAVIGVVWQAVKRSRRTDPNQAPPEPGGEAREYVDAR